MIFAGSALIGLQGPGGNLDALGGALIVAACLGWAIDNNLTQKLSIRDPFQIVAVKAGVASVVNIGLALTRGETLPEWAVLLGALALGACAYGISILLDAYALHALGAAREAAVFAMAAGVILLVGARHEHEHVHEPLLHDHRHVHDEHHQHEHDRAIDGAELHSHLHRHDPLVHAHPHVSDVHHHHPHN